MLTVKPLSGSLLPLPESASSPLHIEELQRECGPGEAVNGELRRHQKGAQFGNSRRPTNFAARLRLAGVIPVKACPELPSNPQHFADEEVRLIP